MKINAEGASRYQQRRDEYINAAADRGDWRQAIAYVLGVRRRNVPEDVGPAEFREAKNLKPRAWFARYGSRRH